MMIQCLPGHVHIWQSSLVFPANKLQFFLNILSADERQRADRFIQTIHRDYFIAAHGMKRDILSRYVDQSANDLQFQRTAHGKPYLLQVGQLGPLQFNLSHSGDLLLLAVTWRQEIGIDVENTSRRTECLDIAKRFFSDREYQQLSQLPIAQQRDGFYRGWTRKEAYVKVIGEGLSHPLKDFDVDVSQHAESLLLSVDGDEEKARGWTLFNVELVGDYIGACALEGELNGEVHRFSV